MRGILVKERQTSGNAPIINVTPESVGWEYLRLQVYRLAPGEALSEETAAYETGLVVLGGRCTVGAGDAQFESIGERPDVWSKTPPYAVLLPPGIHYEVVAETPLHLLVAGALCRDESGGAPRLITPQEITAEDRGAGNTYRRIHHILPPKADSIRLQLVEVYTPAGNWSSFPPHKHDTEDPPREAYLEETYYYQINPKDGFALQRVYTHDGSLDQTCAPHDGDVVLVPKGYHPVSAMPGYDCYYLNVMAGPTKEWNFTVDHRYEWLMNWQKPD